MCRTGWCVDALCCTKRPLGNNASVLHLRCCVVVGEGWGEAMVDWEQENSGEDRKTSRDSPALKIKRLPMFVPLDY